MDSRSSFVQRFGDLIALLRADPGNDAAQDLALAAATGAVAAQAVEVEAGIHWSVIPEDLTLKGRLLARQVDVLRVAAGAEPHELLALARALSHDAVPLPSSPHIELEMVHFLAPPDEEPGEGAERPTEPSRPVAPRRRAAGLEDRRRPGRAHHLGIERRRGADRRAPEERRRLELIRDQRTEIVRLHEALGRASAALAWDLVLTAALALVRLVPKVPAAERRSFGIQLRRAVPRRAIEALVDVAEREVGAARARHRGAAVDRPRCGGGRARPAAGGRGAGASGASTTTCSAACRASIRW